MPETITALLAGFSASALQACVLYLACACFLHCFFDDAIVITKKQLLIAAGGFLELLIQGIPRSMIIGFVIGVFVGAMSSAYQVDYTPSVSDQEKMIELFSLPIYLGIVLMLSVIPNSGFRKTVRRFFAALLTMGIISTALDLSTEMLLYCATETGLFSTSIVEVSLEKLISIQLLTSFFGIILTLILYFRIYRRGITLRMRKTDLFSILLYFIVELLMYFFFKVIEMKKIPLAGGSTVLRIIIVGIMLLLLIVMPVLIIRSRISVSYQERNAYQEKFLEAELEASRQFRQAQEDTRAFRHDIQNNLTVIAMLMQEGKTREAEQFLNDMRTEVNALSPRIVTGDDMVDSLISAKLRRIEELGIDFKTDGVIDGGLNWKPMDICTLFANLLDNAIEAASQTEQGFITLEFRKSEHHRLIRASNSCPEDVDCRALTAGSHITSKPDKSLHGYGIGNIRRTVGKYGGMMKITCENHVFTMEIILNR